MQAQTWGHCVPIVEAFPVCGFVGYAAFAGQHGEANAFSGIVTDCNASMLPKASAQLGRMSWLQLAT